MGTRDSKTGVKKIALGKGINSLLGDFDIIGNSFDSTKKAVPEENAEFILQLDLDDIEVNPHQPRKVFDEEELKELSESIKENGLLQPILVTKGEKTGKYIIIAGERRFRASKQAGMKKISALVKDGAENDMLRLALIENIQRADLNIIEEAEAYNSLIKDFGLTQEQCAISVGKDRSTITNAIRLLGLPFEIRDDLIDNRLSMGHGRALLSIDDKNLLLKAREIVLKKQLSVRDTEQLCKSFNEKSDKQPDEQNLAADPDLEYIAESLRSHLKTKVKISGTSQRGRVEIYYFSGAELERISSLLGNS